MRTIHARLTLLLRANRTIYFCDACLTLKMGDLPVDVRDAMVVIGERYNFQAIPGRCSECLRDKHVIRARAA